MTIPNAADTSSTTAGRLETRLKKHPLVAHAAVVGDGRVNRALLVLAPDAGRRWGDEYGYWDLSLVELARLSPLRAELAGFVARLNERLAQNERIVNFAVLADEWRPDSDVLTPTGRLRRHAVHDRYFTVIAELGRHS